jgi:protein-S-isoprenylcysteine O-methyltransferase Ste14
MRRAFAQTVGLLVLEAALLFVPAGRLDWPMAWALLGAYAIVAATGFAALDPELIAERAKPTPGFDPVDAVLATTSGIALILLPLPIAALEAGRGAPRFPVGLRVAALGVFLLGSLCGIWAAHANRFFSDFVRIQSERGHHVVTGGPYALVRHPGYASGIAAYVAVPIALGSAWALVPALLGAALLAVRCAREDRILHAKLDGYRAYAERVRHRLLPGVW